MRNRRTETEASEQTTAWRVWYLVHTQHPARGDAISKRVHVAELWGVRDRAGSGATVSGMGAG